MTGWLVGEWVKWRNPAGDWLHGRIAAVESEMDGRQIVVVRLDDGRATLVGLVGDDLWEWSLAPEQRDRETWLSGYRTGCIDGAEQERHAIRAAVIDAGFGWATREVLTILDARDDEGADHQSSAQRTMTGPVSAALRIAMLIYDDKRLLSGEMPSTDAERLEALAVMFDRIDDIVADLAGARPDSRGIQEFLRRIAREIGEPA